ncbi:MAG: glycosyltransferase family 4 protein [Synechococcales cyanobacterium RM1_1_8]|nr:glycosyltransferase family 4 protein [Synechococcales cyanobacterium RM1_1_8]
MLKALIDVTPVTPRPSGVGLYVINLVRALQAIAQTSDTCEIETLLQPGLKDWLLRRAVIPPCGEAESIAGSPACHVWDLPVRMSAPMLQGAYHAKPLQQLLAQHLDQRFASPNIIHGTNYAVCPSRKAKTIMNIYDLTFIRYPEFVDRVVKTYRAQVERCLSWTDLVITISESSKRDIVEYLGVDASRVWVTPLASQYAPLPVLEYSGGIRASSSMKSSIGYDPTREILDDLAKTSSYDGQRPYLLFVSTIEPRKNIGTLIEAFNRLKANHRIDHALLLVGKKGWHYEPVFEAIAQSPWRDHIHHLNYLSQAQVQALYSQADAFVYPSFYEGFGLPILEAMTLGAPVVTANVSSLPEVGGDAALYADPRCPDELAEQIWRLLDDPSLRQCLVERGRLQAARFSWQRTAERTLEAYHQLL